MKKSLSKLSLLALLGIMVSCGGGETSNNSSTQPNSGSETSVSQSTASGSSTSSSSSTVDNPSSTTSSSENSVSSTTTSAEQVQLSTIAQVKATPTSQDVKFRGTYQGKNNKTSTYNSVEQWTSVYVADGSEWIQLYQFATSLLPQDIALGDVVEVEGKTAHYTPSGATKTTYEVKPTSIKKVDATLEQANWLTINNETQPALTAEMVNQGAHIENAVVTSKKANNYGTLTIEFKVVDTDYTLYLDSRYTDVTIADLANLAENDIFSCDTFVGLNKDVPQFIYCNNFVRTPGAKVDVTGVNVEASELALTVGQSKMIKASVVPANATVKDLTYASLNEEVATVDATGKVTAVAEGTATIEVSSTDNPTVKAQVNVTVTASSGEVQTKSVTYDFSNVVTTATSESYTDATLLAEFSANASGTSVVSATSSVTSIFKAKTSEAAGLKGIKLGSSKISGTFTLTTSEIVKKISVSFASWRDDVDSKLSIGAVENATKSKTTPETFDYEFADGNTSFVFTATNRLIITSIVLYY